MLDKLQTFRDELEELNAAMMDPEVTGNQKKMVEIGRRRSRLDSILVVGDQYEEMINQAREAREVIDSGDEELAELAQHDLEEAEGRLPKLEKELTLLLLPPDERDHRNAIVEIRAGAGGDEASLFAGELYRMYSRYAENNGWKLEAMDTSPTELGGFKEVVFSVSGPDVFRKLKYESGVHRVQRVPATESSGRIHTSAASVAILPEAEEVELVLDESELRIDVCRASGPGGQSVNTTDSAVRITHVPTGIVVRCQDEKSQHKNKAKALRILRSRLYEMKLEEEHNKIAAVRKSQIGSGDRSAKIRTYNFPQGRVTDHRIHLTLHKLPQVLDGSLDELVEALAMAHQEELLQATDA